jgi:hypothetical protein
VLPELSRGRRIWVADPGPSAANRSADRCKSDTTIGDDQTSCRQADQWTDDRVQADHCVEDRPGIGCGGEPESRRK